ncbi:hypothetical protein, partial [Salmonella sp. SAL4356]|uniref:hypothetical protein n=1 Tax=Salmonella sp. SAL4356 TaxID=3159877 RepID=UPI003979E39E
IIDRAALFSGERADDLQPLVPDWPTLGQLGLDKRARAERLAGIGGSDANTILSGDRERILGLWREKRGEQPPVDLSA